MAGCTVNAVYVGLSGGHKLVRLSTTPDSPSGARQDLGVRFMSRYFLRPHEELLHGIELIAIWLQASPREVEEDLARHDARGERAAVVEQYAGGSRPLFGCAAAGHGDLLNHFEIVEFLLAAGAPEFRPALNQVIAAFNPGWVTATLNRTFGPLLRRRRLEWIDSLLRFRHARLVSLQGAAT